MGPKGMGDLTPFENVPLIRNFGSIFPGFESPASGFATQIMDSESFISMFESEMRNCFRVDDN
jgi:hypothetical protein